MPHRDKIGPAERPDRSSEPVSLTAQRRSLEPLKVHATLGLAADPKSARRARKFISEFCNAADLGEDLCATASLLVSELVANAVLHGGSRTELDARMPDGTLRVAVTDNNPNLPSVGNTPDLAAESGRGLILVSTLADRWGVERVPSGGKAVWFELDVNPHPAVPT